MLILISQHIIMDLFRDPSPDNVSWNAAHQRQLQDNDFEGLEGLDLLEIYKAQNNEISEPQHLDQKTSNIEANEEISEPQHLDQRTSNIEANEEISEPQHLDQRTSNIEANDKISMLDIHDLPSPQLEQEETKPSPMVNSSRNRGIDYEKNIYAYISKVIVKFFIGEKLRSAVVRFCKTIGCTYKEAVDYYKMRQKQVFGIGHLSTMLIPESKEEVKIKKVFYIFLNWFLRGKYLVYMVRNGKMEDKEIYIQYKNQFFLHLDGQIRKFY